MLQADIIAALERENADLRTETAALTERLRASECRNAELRRGGVGVGVGVGVRTPSLSLSLSLCMEVLNAAGAGSCGGGDGAAVGVEDG